jgi:hypothetical protein
LHGDGDAALLAAADAAARGVAALRAGGGAHHGVRAVAQAELRQHGGDARALSCGCHALRQPQARAKLERFAHGEARQQLVVLRDVAHHRARGGAAQRRAVEEDGAADNGAFARADACRQRIQQAAFAAAGGAHDAGELPRAQRERDALQNGFAGRQAPRRAQREPDVAQRNRHGCKRAEGQLRLDIFGVHRHAVRLPLQRCSSRLQHAHPRARCLQPRDDARAQRQHDGGCNHKHSEVDGQRSGGFGRAVARYAQPCQHRVAVVRCAGRGRRRAHGVRTGPDAAAELVGQQQVKRKVEETDALDPREKDGHALQLHQQA